MISHRNVIANTLQVCTYDQPARDFISKDYKDVALGLLPQSHIYALIVVCHCSTYRGDQVVVLPKFDIKDYLNSVASYRINSLYIVPPIIIAMTKNKSLLDKFDLRSVRTIFTGAAPLGREVAELLQEQYPDWLIRQGYGLTETCTCVCSTSAQDVWFGSSGSILCGIECRLVSLEGNEVTGYDQPGELLVKSPSVVLGYLKNEQATKETFIEDGEGGRWMRTGDEAVIKKGSSGYEHVWIVDRIKELIKVKVCLLALIHMMKLTAVTAGLAGCTGRARSSSSYASRCR
jgi:acyl-CoA synthetase (AMP-forming)/AMP-acid ligase II